MMPTVLIVTGASRGFGRALATAFAAAASTESNTTLLSAVLVARDKSGLEKTREQMLARQDGSRVECVECDLGELSTLEDRWTREVEGRLSQVVNDNEDGAHLIFLNNAGSLGTLAPCTEQTFASMQSSFDFNVTSCCYQSSRIAKWCSDNPRVKRTTIVNVSSLAAVQAFETWGVYCAGKSARDMYHATMALEYKSKEEFKTMNYAPGPMDTDMQKTIRESEGCDFGTREYFIDAKAKGTLVDPAKSAEKLASLVIANTFASGAHIDFYDKTE